MTTKRRKSKKKYCKYGKLKRTVRTKHGKRRRCKKTKYRKLKRNRKRKHKMLDVDVEYIERELENMNEQSESIENYANKIGSKKFSYNRDEQKVYIFLRKANYNMDQLRNRIQQYQEAQQMQEEYKFYTPYHAERVKYHADQLKYNIQQANYHTKQAKQAYSFQPSYPDAYKFFTQQAQYHANQAQQANFHYNQELESQQYHEKQIREAKELEQEAQKDVDDLYNYSLYYINLAIDERDRLEKKYKPGKLRPINCQSYLHSNQCITNNGICERSLNCIKSSESTNSLKRFSTKFNNVPIQRIAPNMVDPGTLGKFIGADFEIYAYLYLFKLYTPIRLSISPEAFKKGLIKPIEPFNKSNYIENLRLFDTYTEDYATQISIITLDYNKMNKEQIQKTIQYNYPRKLNKINKETLKTVPILFIDGNYYLVFNSIFIRFNNNKGELDILLTKLTPIETSYHVYTNETGTKYYAREELINSIYATEGEADKSTIHTTYFSDEIIIELKLDSSGIQPRDKQVRRNLSLMRTYGNIKIKYMTGDNKLPNGMPRLLRQLIRIDADFDNLDNQISEYLLNFLLKFE